GPALPFALIAAAVAIWSRRSWFFPVLAGALVLSSWSVRNVYGAELNNLLPAFAGIALLVSSLGNDREGRKKTLGDALLVLQLLWLVYSPTAFVPTRADRAAGDEIVR